MEMLDIVDDKGEPTGEREERTAVHEKGLHHRTSHVWILRHGKTGPEVLLQKRSDDKDSYPGCYDISSAGHIPAGAGFADSAVRELEEELGVKASEKDLIIAGDLEIAFSEMFHGKMFNDRQYSRVFYMILDADEDAFTLQKEEVSSVRWMELEELKKAVDEGTIRHCIVRKELDMLPEKI